MPRLHVARRESSGTGRHPLLFVHGAWHASWCWTEHVLAHVAAQGFEAAALDLRGHGDSHVDRLRTVRGRDYVDDVAEVAGSFSAPPVVIGHSMGGYVVQKYLERHRAPGGALVASVPPRGVIGVTTDTARRRPGAFARMNATWSLLPVVEPPDEARAMFYSDRLDEATALEYSARVQDESYLAFLDMLVLDRPKPARVTDPVLVIGGVDDQIFPPSDVRATAAAYGTEAVVFEAGHNLMLEPVWADVADAITAWVETLD